VIWADVDPEAARRAADDILADPAYREPQPSLADRVFEAIGDLLGRAVGALTGSGAGSLIGTVVVVALLALAGFLLARALRTPGRRRRTEGPDGAVVGTSSPDDPDVWSAEADRLAAAGDLRGALRCRYQALVAHLVRDRVVPDQPARTPAELRDQLAASRPDLAAPLGDVTDRFEAVWYGGAPVSPDDLQRFTVATEAVRADAVRRPARAA